MSPAALRAGLTLMLLTAAGSARAESTLLPGFQIGGALTDLPTAPKHLDFRLGAGLDWVHSAGPVLALRVDTSHRVDATFALLAGYWGEGLRAGQGLPLGITAGGWLGTDVRGDLTDCLIGNLATDFTKLFAAVAEFAKLPPKLEHGRRSEAPAQEAAAA